MLQVTIGPLELVCERQILVQERGLIFQPHTPLQKGLARPSGHNDRAPDVVHELADASRMAFPRSVGNASGRNEQVWRPRPCNNSGCRPLRFIKSGTQMPAWKMSVGEPWMQTLRTNVLKPGLFMLARPLWPILLSLAEMRMPMVERTMAETPESSMAVNHAVVLPNLSLAFV